MRIYHLKGVDIEKTVPADGESIEVIIPQTEQDEFLYFDLTLACMLTEDLKSAVRFYDFAFEEKPDASDFEPNGLIKLQGAVEDGHRFVAVFSDFQKQIEDEDLMELLEILKEVLKEKITNFLGLNSLKKEWRLKLRFLKIMLFQMIKYFQVWQL